ncbi:MAG TPA: alpha-xylosidase [Dictyoglomaceae bacterium]|nr:alpha-xylosidase [Dictyoglomaceae bacterium]HOL39873.1 alpha-xylosidase [Dictyoglomaceae bacterium]HPP16331.1 alpha-xylosidase [Dictyoglomaceae bacterium]
MKFTEGHWRVKEGIKIHYPSMVWDYELKDNSIIVYAPATFVRNRGETLFGPLFEIHFSSPFANVIEVASYHFKGLVDKGPHFEVYRDKDYVPEVEDKEETLVLKAGDLKVIINKKGAFSFTFYWKNKKLTSSGVKHMAYALDENKNSYMIEALDLAVGELVYGLGERFGAFVKNGQTVEMWNADAGTVSDQAYKNVPFYITNRNYGLFVNHPEKVSFEIATENVERVQFSVPGENINYFVIGGENLKGVLGNYTKLTGKPKMPPDWSFGLWLTTSFITNYDEKTVTSFIEGMRDRNIPLHVFHFDCFWMKEYHWVDFEWDDRVFPNPQEMLKRLKDKGLKICVWMNPYIAQRSKLFEEGKEKGYLLKKPDGSCWQTDDWQPGMGIVDFTNPEARKWFSEKLKKLIKMGVDVFKTDFGERIPTDVVYYDGSDPEKMHNFYTYLYNKTVFETLEKELGEGNAIVFARSATAGSQKFPTHWGGDSLSTYESMLETLRGGLSLGLCGFGFWSHDIAGFDSSATSDLYKRWVAFGLLSSHSRLHGNYEYKVPWLYDEEAVDVLRFFVNLKCTLMPYIYANAVEAVQGGVPLLRAMVLDFQEDPTCHYLDRQYMFGDDLLVAPVFSEDGKAEYYLPDVGIWTNFITGEKKQGGKWYKEKFDYFSLPLMARPGSIIPIGNNKEKPDYDYANGVTLYVFEPKDGVESLGIVYNQKKEIELKVRLVKEGNKINIHIDKDSGKIFSILLFNTFEIKSILGGRGEKKEKGILITPDKGAKEIEVTL